MIIDSRFPESVKNFVDSVPFIEIQDSFSLCEDEVNNLLTAQLQSMIPVSYTHLLRHFLEFLDVLVLDDERLARLRAHDALVVGAGDARVHLAHLSLIHI